MYTFVHMCLEVVELNSVALWAPTLCRTRRWMLYKSLLILLLLFLLFFCAVGCEIIQQVAGVLLVLQYMCRKVMLMFKLTGKCTGTFFIVIFCFLHLNSGVATVNV